MSVLNDGKFVAEVFVGRMARPPIRTEQKLDIES
jgi:hypothetical protein